MTISQKLFKCKIYEVCPHFEVNENNKQLLNAIFEYVNNREGALDPKKGILLIGDVGTGKPTLIKIIGEVLRIKGEGYKTVNCSFLASQFASEGMDALESSTYNVVNNGSRPINRAFDELGREPIPAKHYGNEKNVMQYVFQCRYELRDRAKTFATTNLMPEVLGKLYGDYIEDRLVEMFNIVQMNGKSLRR